jgi:hypothetical protein
MRRAAKRDHSERDIRDALDAVGAQWLLLCAFDLLVCFRGQLFMLEVKTGKGHTTWLQDRLLARGWPLHIVRTPAEALHVIGAVPMSASESLIANEQP